MEQTHQSFIAGFRLYESRLDKGYSLTDCISLTLAALKVTAILKKFSLLKAVPKQPLPTPS